MYIIMMTPTELLQQYQRIVAEPINRDLEESVTILCKTDWVKIMIIRDAQLPETCYLEVEISLPPCVIELAANNEDAQTGLARKFIEDTISHLEYLIKLEEAGLILGILSAEGIWSASLVIRECPDEKIFEVLIPPH
jgi:hypothetical protein